MTTNTSGEDLNPQLKSRWATILAVDVVGYTRLMSDDPKDTVETLDVVRAIVREATENNGGYVVDYAGDSMLATFDTALGAIYAATASQQIINERADAAPDNRKMILRMGIHNGEILEKSDATIYGDGVNIAARLESLAPPGAVTVSEEVRQACGEKPPFSFFDQGQFDVKNVSRPVHVHLIEQAGGAKALEQKQRIARVVTKGNLPQRASELIGREAELDELKGHLQTSRLVTLFGMGGLGKTSIAVEAGRLVSSQYPDGVWFADLAAVSDESAVALAIAGVFGVTQQADKTMLDSLCEALAGRQFLLILDNCEHVIKSAATLADALLTNCPKVSLIATSREQLSIRGEQIMYLKPLQTGGASSAAEELFVLRAQAVSPAFDAADHAAEIRSLCTQLDGIPLAIELAAARVKSMTPKQIQDRLNQRFRLLTGGSRAESHERHQTLRNAVQWSYDLLDKTEETVLNRTTVFSGGFTLEAAETVCEGDDVDLFEIIDALDSLVSKSLLTVTQSDGGMRYGVLETIRAFGSEKLSDGDDEAAVREKHAQFYADQSDANFKLWRSPKQSVAHAWLDLEINNLRDAFHWAKDHGAVDPAARIASSVGDLARFRLREEAANWAEEIVDQARTAQHPRLIVLLTWSASTAWAFGRFDDAKRFGEEAISLLDNDALEPFVWAYGDLAFVSIFGGDVDNAIDLLAKGAAHPADEVDRFIIAFHLFIMATAGHADKAKLIADDVIAKVDAVGVPMSMAIAHGARGAAIEADDPEGALKEYEFAIEVANTSGARFMETLIAPRLAAVHMHSGDPEVALQGFERMLTAYGDVTDMASVSAMRSNLVILFARNRQFNAGATLHGSLVGKVDQSSLADQYKDAMAQIRDGLGTRAFSDATENGAKMSLREATNYATSQVRFGLESLAAEAKVAG